MAECGSQAIDDWSGRIAGGTTVMTCDDLAIRLQGQSYAAMVSFRDRMNTGCCPNQQYEQYQDRGSGSWTPQESLKMSLCAASYCRGCERSSLCGLAAWPRHPNFHDLYMADMPLPWVPISPIEHSWPQNLSQDGHSSTIFFSGLQY